MGRHRDGDTFLADRLDLGWGNVIEPMSAEKPGYCAIRLLLPGGAKYDAPEVHGPDKARGDAATAYSLELMPVGTEVEVLSYGVDDFGRTLAALLLPGGRDLATLMVAAGHVKGGAVPT